MRSCPLVPSLCLVSLLVAAAPAAAQSGIQITPDSRRVLVSKDVGPERWALTRNLDDGLVTGNVFLADGGPPQFISCDELAREGENIRLQCFGSVRCPLTPCTTDEWQGLGEVVLPASFFERASVAAPAADARLGRVSGGVVFQEPAAPAGVQLTPDRKGTLINKDVGQERWAITLNGDDATVTGNVFFPDGSDPAFIWCQRTGQNDSDLVVDCFGAERCGDAGCQSEDWTRLFEVSIAESFFDPPSQVSSLELDAALRASLGEDAGFDALVNALARGYSLRQVARGGLVGRITPPGEIVTAGGGVEPPEERPLEPSAGGAMVGRVRQGGPMPTPSVIRFTPEAIRRVFRESSPAAFENFTRSLLFLANRGYSVRQIFEAVDEGRLQLDVNAVAKNGIEDSFILVDDDGDPLEPSPIEVGEVFTLPESARGRCGNGVVEPGESCDVGNSRGKTCESFGFESGALACDVLTCRFDTRNCRSCGNGEREPGEECDRKSIRKLTCQSRDPNHPTDAIPGCSDDCRLDWTPCDRAVLGGCPDGVLQDGEDCDGAAIRGPGTCVSENLNLVGSLVCDLASCTWSTRECHPVTAGCGDGALDAGEDCDGTAFRETLCVSLDQERFVGGLLRCRALSCTYNTAGCTEREPSPGPSPSPEPTREPGPTETPSPAPTGAPTPAPTEAPTPEPTPDPPSGPTPTPAPVCGNGVIESPDEECEGTNLRGASCDSIGFGFGPGGSLRCNSACRFDSSDCVLDTAPTVTAVGPNPLVAPVNGSGILTVFFEDPNGDVTQGCLTNAPGFNGGCSSFNTGGQTIGSVAGPVNCAGAPASFNFFAYVIDSNGNESNRFPARLVCED